ncbi:ABC transporter substrate-binding protein [Desulfatiglans anilini]|uniref:ABC transporter substrate-binding protein n=1 Tax=Desulfatiglans anilini TaxID=90728 RepID=UPI0006890E0C|nr:ABC transporter substrate-binding protein [Desulfatiglans anilini]
MARTTLFSLFVALTSVFSACVGEAGAEAPAHDPMPAEKAIVLAVEFCSHAACAYVAEEKGWYGEAEVPIESFDSYVTGMALSAALTRGEIDAAYICLIPAICAFANAKVPLKIVAGTHRYGYAVSCNPERITSPADLQKPGIRIGCAREGSPTDALLQKAVDVYRLNQQKVAENIRRMSPPKQLLALRMGHLDAAVMPEQYPSMAESAGFPILLTAQDLWPDMQGSVLIVTERFLERNPRSVLRLVEVTERSTEWINRNPEAAAQILAKALRITGNRIFPVKEIEQNPVLDATPQALQRSLTERLVCTTRIDPEQVQKTIDYLANLGYIRQRFEADQILAIDR